MLLKIAFVLLIAWLLGVLGLYRIGDLVHVLLLGGLCSCYWGRSRLGTLP